MKIKHGIIIKNEIEFKKNEIELKQEQYVIAEKRK